MVNDHENIVQKVKDMMNNRPRHVTYEHIEAATGLSRHWQAKFIAGQYDDPKLSQICKLWRYLTKKPFEWNANEG